MIHKSPVLLNDAQYTRWLDRQHIRPDALAAIPEPQSYPCILVIFEEDSEFPVIEHTYIYRDDLTVAKVGVGATKYVGSDRYPYTVIQVISDKKLVLQADDYKRTDNNGLSELQTYDYTPNPDGPTDVVTLRRNGRWVREGESMKGGTGFFIGEREAYNDPSF